MRRVAVLLLGFWVPQACSLYYWDTLRCIALYMFSNLRATIDSIEGRTSVLKISVLLLFGAYSKIMQKAGSEEITPTDRTAKGTFSCLDVRKLEKLKSRKAVYATIITCNTSGTQKRLNIVPLRNKEDCRLHMYRKINSNKENQF